MNSDIILLFTINVFSAIGYSLIAPLYPSLAKSRGVDDYLIGIIFSVFALSNLCTIPLTRKIISYFGRTRLLYYAIILEAFCTILFASVNLIHNYFLFIFISVITRLCQGIGSALSATLVYSIAASSCTEENLKSTMGYIELAYSVGLTLGPIFASCLYYLGGFSFPFLVSGLIELLCMKFISNLKIKEEDNSDNEPNFFKILFNREIIITFLSITASMISNTFFYPVFTLHLFNKFGLSLEVSSIFFVISMFSYFIVLQFIDKITNKIGIKLTIYLGLSINVFAVLFLSPIYLIPQNLIFVIFGLIVTGITAAFILVPGIIDFMETMKKKMKMEETVANDVSSGKNKNKNYFN